MEIKYTMLAGDHIIHLLHKTWLKLDITLKKNLFLNKNGFSNVFLYNINLYILDRLPKREPQCSSFKRAHLRKKIKKFWTLKKLNKKTR